jgi:hypothetical protein
MPKLTIAGPNLTSGSTFHVHKAGCRDLKSRAKGYVGVEMDTEDFSSVQEICENVYSDHMAENEEGSIYATWEGYVSEFDIFPCVGKLPVETPEQATEGIQENSLPSDPPEVTVVTSSKAAPAKRTAKEAPKVTSTKTAKTTRTWNASKAKMVVKRRDSKGMSWAEIGNELGFSPRTVRAMYDSVQGTDAHFESRLPGKGGRIRNGVVLPGERD